MDSPPSRPQNINATNQIKSQNQHHTTGEMMKSLDPAAFRLHNRSSAPLVFSSLRRLSRRRISVAAAAFPPPPSFRRPDGEHSAAAAPRPSRRDELALFMDLVPVRMRRDLAQREDARDLIEVVMDLGRKPIARFPAGDWIISQQPVGAEDLNHAVSKVGDFSDDNRSGINHSLHRISAIRNRKMQIIGLTCRVGRAVSGSAEMIDDLVEGGGSILVIGPPGVGKTTLIREIARTLADEHMKRVVIVDTSNEIGGDGDVPHLGIGRARRMQVPNVNMQHNVMIEAVENHMPEVIIIDEIGTELEAMAASTIAQRGVQLVATAHGVTIESIIKNPCLQTLVGGIESVTLGDDEARKRKVQKTILERKGPPTFSCAIEMVSKLECRVHHKLEATVDTILAGKSPLFEVRKVDSKVHGSGNSVPVPGNLIEMETVHGSGNSIPVLGNLIEMETVHGSGNSVPVLGNLIEMETVTCTKDENSETYPSGDESKNVSKYSKKESRSTSTSRRVPMRVYTYKILEADLLQVATVMGLEDDIDVTDDIGTAEAILASSSEMRQNPWIRSVAKFHKLPVFVIKENTMAQMVKAVKMILKMDSFDSVLSGPEKQMESSIEIEDDAPKRKPSLEEIDALEEVRLAIEYIVIPGGEPVELLPRCSEIIARQLELVESYQLAAEKSGTELNSRLQILPLKLNKKASSLKGTKSRTSKQTESNHLTSKNSGGAGLPRLPLLPE